MARKKKTEKQMQMFENGGLSQTEKAKVAEAEMEDALKKGISEKVKKLDGTLVSKTYKNPTYAAEDILRMLKAGEITVENAEKFLKEQKEAGNYSEGGLQDEGGTVDPVSGNAVPVGSTQKEVRDDIPAQLSEGEFVFPADVTRYIGLENLMQLRNKAKQGLAQMEAMGQMGNSDEATMSDTAEMEVDIDSMIDEFDPNDPSTMEFNEGGIVYAQQGALIPGQPAPQQFSYGYMPPSQQQGGYQVPGIPQAPLPNYSQFISRPAQAAGTGKVPTTEQRQYIGPNGELITIMFIDGKPQQEIPSGYKVYKPEEQQQQAPKITQPTVTQPTGGDGDDDGGRKEKREAQMARDKQINNTLASLDSEFAKLIENDPFMTGKPTLNISSAIYAGVQTNLGRTPAIERIAKKYNIDLDNYTNTGLEGVFSKYDDAKFAKDVKGIIEDPKREEKAIAQRTVGSVQEYKDLGMTIDEAKAQRRQDLDEIADFIDAGDKGVRVSITPADDTPTSPSAVQAERDRQEAQDRQEESGRSAGAVGGEDTEAIGSFSKGGAVQEQTKRALKSSRKK